MKKRFTSAFAVVTVVGVTAILMGQSGNPFVARNQHGETVRILPTPASIRTPHDPDPLFAPAQPGYSVYRSSYGAGNLQNHGGHQIPNAGFFAIYWNGTVANAGGSGVTSLGYSTLQAQISAFTAAFADGRNYTQTDPNADYTVIQQYGQTDPISSSALSPALTSLGYFIDSQSVQSSIDDTAIQSYLAGLFDLGTVPVNASVIYGVYFPAGMTVTLDNSASCSNFCGYHGSFTYTPAAGGASQVVKYAAFPYLNCSACKLSSLSVADMMTIVTSHEIREAVTDPNLDAWFDIAGYEADDKCAWHNLYQTANGGFWVQPEFSNGGRVTASGFTATYPQLSKQKGGCVVAK